jgi:hypothetical protein
MAGWVGVGMLFVALSASRHPWALTGGSWPSFGAPSYLDFRMELFVILPTRERAARFTGVPMRSPVWGLRPIRDFRLTNTVFPIPRLPRAALLTVTTPTAVAHLTDFANSLSFLAIRIEAPRERPTSRSIRLATSPKVLTVLIVR